MKFSIITPSYNQGSYIRETIESVITQEGDFEIEYFILDGGSTDNSIEIIKKYEKIAKNNPKIKFYWRSQKDNGQIDAINQGLSKISGDIVAYINSDDYYLPNAFSVVAKYFSDHPDSQWLVGNCLVSDQKLSWTFWLKHLWPVNLYKSALYFLNTINQPSVFLSKKIIEKVGKFDPKYKYSFDHDYWLRCSQVKLPNRIFTNLSFFRTHPTSISNKNFKLQLNQDRQIIAKYTQSNHFVQLINKFLGSITEFYYNRIK